jgi:hypothetical protein
VEHTTKSVRRDQFAARAHACVLDLAGQGVIRDEFVGDDFDADELGDLEEIIAGNAQQEGDRVADVAKDELQGEISLAVLGDVDVSIHMISFE